MKESGHKRAYKYILYDAMHIKFKKNRQTIYDKKVRIATNFGVGGI